MKKADQIKKVAVVGAGLMGHGIAQAFAQEGFPVTITDVSESALAAVKDKIRANLITLAEGKLIGTGDVAPALDRISIAGDLAAAVGDADFVTEAVFENLEIKQKTFQEMEKSCSPDTVLASNTSSIPMTDIAALMARPERAVITHWFNPPYLVPLVEIVLGKKTSEEASAISIDLLTRIKKVPVKVQKEIPGFLINRIQAAMNREVYSLVEMGAASAEDIDLAIKASLGFRLASLGPLVIRDLAGLEVTYKVEGDLLKEIYSGTEIPKIFKEKIDRGELGTKTGKGFFEYTPESVAAIIQERDRQFVRRLKDLYRS